MPLRRYRHPLFTAILCGAALVLGACSLLESGKDSEDRVTVTYSDDLWFQAVTLYDNSDDPDSIGFGWDFGGAFRFRDWDSTRAPGVYIFGFQPDSVQLFYYLPGSREAWAPLGRLEDSMRVSPDDTVMNRRYWELKAAFERDYHRIRMQPRSACTFRFGPLAESVDGGVTLREASVNHSVENIPFGFRVHVAAKPGRAVDFEVSEFKLPLTVSCPDPLK